MTDHPITPPKELTRQWREQAPRYRDGGAGREEWLIERSAQWGADQELEACIAWFDRHIPGYELVADKLRAARRPKPPTLAEQGLTALRSTPCTEQCHYDALLAALNRLKQLEDSND